MGVAIHQWHCRFPREGDFAKCVWVCVRERWEIRYKDAFNGLVVQAWKKELCSLEFKDALVIGEREENGGGTLLQSLEEEKKHSLRADINRVLKDFEV